MLNEVHFRDNCLSVDSEMDKLFSMIVIDSRRHTRAAPARRGLEFQNIAEIPPPARFTRKKRNSARTNQGGALPADASLSKESTPMTCNSIGSKTNGVDTSKLSDFDKMLEFIMGTDYPGDFSAAQPLSLNN